MQRERTATVARGSLVDVLAAQWLLGTVVAVMLPAFIRFGSLRFAFTVPGFGNSFVGAWAAVALGFLTIRRVTAFPGTRTFRYILPAFVGPYGLVLGSFFALRLEYSRIYFSLSFLFAVLCAFAVSSYLVHRVRRCFYVVPGADMHELPPHGGAEWFPMVQPCVPDDRRAIIVADFRIDLDAPWARMLATAAVRGHPVYHVKQLSESLTGRVTIEHLSENNFGSLLPNLFWRKMKRVLDLACAILLLPVLLPVFLIVAIIIRLDTPGPIFFRQERMGAGGRPFRVFKFRTMRNAQASDDESLARLLAQTQPSDERITRVGHVLRRLRIDELPQVFNILLGHMSWIGPRPEAIPLSRWYDTEIPFYLYRHIVRPGITGWAQVNQGHVTDVEAVTRKLQYDFYYIKNFSAWMDLLIAMRTIRILLTGFGSK